MKKYNLSILIPARNEQFLSRTIEDIIKNSSEKTEVIVVLDGQWADPQIEDHSRVMLIHYPESIGQRAATNKAASISQAKYIMKCDAHCCFDKDFDVKMMDEMQEDWTMVPIMKNFHVFDWVCKKCERRWYQGPVPEKCEDDKCDSKEFEKDIVWRAKPSPNSTSYRFNRDLQFKYFGGYKSKQKGDIVETMSLQGSCFMVTREKYWDLDLCDESWGSWGQQGTEVALKTWLSGGRVVCNKNTWYAHLFRTRKGFTWPYPAPGGSQRNARKISQDMFFNNKWEKQIYPLSWLIEKFKPVHGWHDEKGKERLKQVIEAGNKFDKEKGRKPVKYNDKSKSVVFYTDNKLSLKIAHKVQKQLKNIGYPIVSVSLKPMNFGGENIHIKAERGYITMFKQILAGLETSKSDIIFFCEHDVLYHPSHFEFTPEKKDIFYYNTNVWRARYDDGYAVRTDDCRQTSGLCAYRDLLLDHYRKRIEIVERDGFSRRMGFEPGTHNRVKELSGKSERWESKYPNIDIRHGGNLTKSKWKKEDYRNKKYAKGWRETTVDKIEGWDNLSFK